MIKKCFGLQGKLTVALLYTYKLLARIIKWDERNDLAVLTADLDIPTLGLSEYQPWPGYWTLALVGFEPTTISGVNQELYPLSYSGTQFGI